MSRRYVFSVTKQKTKVTELYVQEIAAQLGVRAMPTFILFKDGKAVGNSLGAVPQKLEVRRETELLQSGY